MYCYEQNLCTQTSNAKTSDQHFLTLKDKAYCIPVRNTNKYSKYGNVIINQKIQTTNNPNPYVK